MHNKYIQSLDLLRLVGAPGFKRLISIKREMSRDVCISSNGISSVLVGEWFSFLTIIQL